MYCRMFEGKISAKLSIFSKLLFFIKIFVLSVFEWPLKTCFTLIPKLNKSIDESLRSSVNILYDFLVTVKAAPRECVILDIGKS